MLKKIVIIHGWMHSAKIYGKLKKELEKNVNIKVDLFELPGFGNAEALYFNNIIESYANDFQKFIENNNYDVIIGHSLGGNITLRVANKIIDRKKIILLSPEYYGIKILNILSPFLNIGIKILEWLKNKNLITTFIIKIMSLFTINSWKYITDDVIESARKANPKVAIELIKEMRDDKWRTSNIKNDVYLITGEKDRIITKERMSILKNDINGINSIEIKGIGHTAVLEDFDALLNSIRNIMEIK